MIVSKSNLYLYFLILLPFLNIINKKTLFLSIFLISLFSLFCSMNNLIKFNKKIKKILVMIFLFIIYTIFVFYNNISYVGGRDVVELAKYFIWIVVLIYGFSSNIIVKVDEYKKILFNILLFELFVICAQILDINIINQFFNIFFNLDKYFFSGRTVGTFANPNLLGFWIILIYFYIRIFNNKFKLSLFLLSFLLVILSSSRTMLLLYVIFNIFFEFKIKNLFKFKSILMILFIGIISYFLIIYILSSDIFIFKYISEVLKLFINLNVDLSKISSISQRFNIWTYVIDYINNDNSLKVLFGFSPRKEYGFTYIDNQYLFTYFRWGVLGSIIFYSIWIYIYIIVSKFNKYKVYSKNVYNLIKFLKIYIFLLLLYGLVGASFSSWTLLLPFFYFLGGILSYEKKIKYTDFNNK